jgi:hypothetical protein
MSGVFQNIDPPPPSPPGECVPPAFVAGGTHSLGGDWGGGSIFCKTPDTALYSTYVSTLWYSDYIKTNTIYLTNTVLMVLHKTLRS